MENALKTLMIAGSLVITCLVISIGNIMVREAREIQAASMQKLTALNQEFSESDIAIYDNLEVNGSEVVNAIKKYQDKIYFWVQTGESSKIYNKNSKFENNSPESNFYIKPNLIFIGEVERDVNDVIKGIVFDRKIN